VIHINIPGADDFELPCLPSGGSKGFSFQKRIDHDIGIVYLRWERKKFITFESKAPCGLELFLFFEDSEDVAVDRFGLESANRLRIDHISLKDCCPRFIYCLIMGYGTLGPDAEISRPRLSHHAGKIRR